MAHPRRFAALDHKALTVGLTAALLVVPMAGVSGAVTLEGALTEAQIAQAESLGLEVEGLTAAELLAAVEGSTGTTTDAVKTAVEDATAAAPAPVADTAEKAAEAAPAPVAEVVAPKGSAETASGDQDYQPVTAPPARSQPSRSTAPTSTPVAPASSSTPQRDAALPASLRNDLRTTSGFTSSTNRPTLQPTAPAPLVSMPFAVQAPQVSGEAVQTPLTALAAAPSIVADAVDAVTTTPLPSHPTGVPGALTATAASLVLMLGAGHVLHRTGTLHRTFAR